MSCRPKKDAECGGEAAPAPADSTVWEKMTRGSCPTEPTDMYAEKGVNTGPQPLQDPIELLTETHGIEAPWLSQIWIPTLFSTVAVVGYIGANWGLRRPIFSGIQNHVLLGTLGWFGGKWFDQKRNDYYAERDAVFRHYIQLHPEDFPLPERKKYADVLESWHPIR